MTYGVTPPPILDYHKPDREDSRWGKGFVTACASLLVWGLGHWIIGRRRAAMGWCAAWIVIYLSGCAAMAIPAMAPALLWIIALKAMLALTVFIVGFLAGRQARLPNLISSPLTRYAVGLLFIAMLYGEMMAFTWLLRHGLAENTTFLSKSMQPTVQPGDIACLSLLPFKPDRENVVAYDMPALPGRPPRQTFVRIMGLPGETIQIVSGHVTVNNEPLPNPRGVSFYRTLGAGMGPGMPEQPIVLGPDEYYVLSDNTNVGFDSRYDAFVYPGHQPGALPRDKIFGLATVIVWPPLRAGLVR